MATVAASNMKVVAEKICFILTFDFCAFKSFITQMCRSSNKEGINGKKASINFNVRLE